MDLTITSEGVDDSIAAKFQRALRSGLCLSIETFLLDSAPEAQQALPELAAVELEFRLQRGESGDSQEYLTRFPALQQRADAVARLQAVIEQTRRQRSSVSETVSFVKLPHDGSETTPLTREGTNRVSPPEVVPGREDPSLRRIGKYEILDEIARGGMGVVYRARHQTIGRLAAIKLIKSGEFAGQDELLRFFAEAEAAASLDHPNIVPVLEVGEHHGQHYMALALVDGPSLWARVKERPFEAPEAARLMELVCRAIAYAHKRGIVHRDIKPQNILVASDGAPKVTDFGLAKQLERDSGLTRTGMAMGTPSYMAPEQAAGKNEEVGPLADVYALGATLYALLTGHPPFQAANPVETVLQVLNQEPVSPRTLIPSIPRDLETICLKALQKQPAKRYASAESLADDLGRYLRNEPIAARPTSRTERVWRWSQRNRALAVAMVGILLTLSLGTIISSLLAHRASVLAVDYQKEAEKATKAAEKEEAQRTAAELQLYIAQITREEARIQAGDHAIAQAGLHSVAWEQRKMEYHYLMRQAYGTPLVLAASNEPPTSIAFGENNLLVTGGWMPRIWDARTGTLQSELAPTPVASVAFVPDGTRLVTGEGRGITLWDVKTGYRLATIKLPSDYERAIAVSPDGARVAGASANNIKLWDAHTYQEVLSLGDQGSRVSSLAYSPDGALLASASGKTIKLWDMRTGQEQQTLDGHSSAIRAIAFHPDGNQLVSSTDDDIKLWDVHTGLESQSPVRIPYGSRYVALSPDGAQLACTLPDNSIALWDWQAGQEQRKLTGHADEVTGIAFTQDGAQLASCSRDNTIRLWNLFLPDDHDTLPWERGRIKALLFNHDGSQLACVSDNAIKFWNMGTGQELQTIKESGARAVGFRSDGMAIVFRQDGTVVRCNPTTGAEVKLDAEPGSFQFASFTIDGNRLVIELPNESVEVWDIHDDTWVRVTSATIAKSATGERESFIRVASRLVGDSSGLTRPWVASGDQWRPISPDGIWYAYTGSLLPTFNRNDLINIKLVEARPDEERTRTLTGHRTDITASAINSRGTRLASASKDGLIKLWDTLSGAELITLRGHENEIRAMAFDPYDRRLVSASLDQIRIWDLRPMRNTIRLPVNDAIPPADNFTVAFARSTPEVVIRITQKEPFIWDLKAHRQTFEMPLIKDLHEWRIESPDGRSRVYVERGQFLHERVEASDNPWVQNLALQRHWMPLWHDENAVRFEKEGNAFAADFHLSRLAKLRPDDAEVKSRLDRAKEAAQGKKAR